MYGTGKQTRSFQYVSDLVNGLIALMASNYTAPVNLGNPIERTIEDFARIIRDLVGGHSKIEQTLAVEDDPQRRRPDITRARKYLDWEPKVVDPSAGGRTTLPPSPGAISILVCFFSGAPRSGTEQNDRILQRRVEAVQKQSSGKAQKTSVKKEIFHVSGLVIVIIYFNSKVDHYTRFHLN